MATGVKTRYHVAINGKGFMLRGAPTQPRYAKSNSQSLLRSFRIQNEADIVDIGYNSFTGTGWNYWSQTDWAGGFQAIQFKDNASFKDGQAIDTIKQYSQVTLQNAWLSAAVVSGAYSPGALNANNGSLIFGVQQAAVSGKSKVLKLTSANVLSTLSAYAGIQAVNTMDRFINNTIIGLSRTSGTVKTMAKYNGTAISGFRSANPIVRALHSVGIRLYSGERVSSLSGDVLYYSTDLATFTSAYQAGKNRSIKYIGDVNGSPYFFINEGNRVDMYRWDEFAERAYPIYSWENLTNYGIKTYLSMMIITGTSNGKSVAFAFNGARLWQIFNDQLQGTSRAIGGLAFDFSRPFEFEGNLHTKGATWDGTYWFPGMYGKHVSSSGVYTPAVNFNNKPYGFATSGSGAFKTIVGYRDSASYNLSGHVLGSEYGANLAGVDKLVNSVSVNFATLAAGQTLEVFRSTDSGATFSSIGKTSYSQDGAVNKKKMYLPSGFVTKLWNYKVVLAGPGTSTPTLKDISFEYRPAPDLKKRWNLSLDASDQITLLNKQQEQRDGKALISDLWLEMESKNIVTYEDVDAFEVSLVSAMIAADTIAVVDSTRLMPPKGRIRVFKNNVAEEMTYTSADGGQIKGITRGRKNSLARDYSIADKIDNFYSVLVTDLTEQVNDTDQKTTESIAQMLILEA